MGTGFSTFLLNLIRVAKTLSGTVPPSFWISIIKRTATKIAKKTTSK